MLVGLLAVQVALGAKGKHADSAGGVGLAAYGLRKKFTRQLAMARMSPRARTVVESLGLDGALRKIATTPLGPWLLVAVALGLVIFGVYSCCEARWRVVRPGSHAQPTARSAGRAHRSVT
jgi:hypothetical protein